MKSLLTIILLGMAFTVVAEESYTEPSELTVAESKKAKADMDKNKTVLKNYWQSRLAVAKKNDEKLAKPGMPLQKPYYGDYKQAD